METLDLGHHVLDRRVVDRDGRVLGKVDDLELTTDADGRLRVTAIVMGPEALGRRLGGRLGSLVAGFGRLRDDDGGPPRIGWDHVTHIGVELRTDLAADELPFPRSEHWLRDHVVAPLAGSRRSSQEGPEGDTPGRSQ